jgi:hypothetical protein
MMPGKFEGEPKYVREMWELAIDGFADKTIFEGDTEISAFLFDDELKRKTGKNFRTKEKMYLALWETSDGFVHSTWIEESKLEAIEESEDEEDED